MTYDEFETLLSSTRLEKYLMAAGGDKRKALYYYRLNIRSSQAVYARLCLFEVVLRNKIDHHYRQKFLELYGESDWLAFAAQKGGPFDQDATRKSQQTIRSCMASLGKRYSHNNLLANLSFGFWRYQFASREFQAMGSSLHTIFPNRPKGTNHTVLFQQLTLINSLRNRIAHHEPICFSRQHEQISYDYLTSHLQQVLELLHWLDIPAGAIFQGLSNPPVSPLVGRKTIALYQGSA